jgi:hypothetical protein
MEGQDPSAMSLTNEPYCDLCRPFGQLLKQGYGCLDWVQMEPHDPFEAIPSKEQNCDLQRPFGGIYVHQLVWLQLISTFLFVEGVFLLTIYAES